MKELSFLAMVLVTISLTGCFYMEPVGISASRDYSALYSPDQKVWRPDETRVIFQNYSDRIYVKIWVGENPEDSFDLEVGPEEGRAPDIELAPEEGRAFNFPSAGVHVVCIAGREATASGWRDLGVKKRTFETYPGGGPREVIITNGDFAGYHRRPPKLGGIHL
jgi:hypothetical protein